METIKINKNWKGPAHMNARFNRLKMVKIAGGCFLAMTIAEGLNLRYGASAGVIALLMA